MDASQVLSNVAKVAAGFASERSARQRRRSLERADFAALAEAGFLLTGLPEAHGGLWRDVASSVRLVSEILRVIARADASVALVCSMHPAVLSFWLAQPRPPAEYAAAWDEQLRWLAQTVLDGHFWGTITSEPGSGGDVTKSQAVARKVDSRAVSYELTGNKHFGSGSGIVSYMITSAVPEGEEQADWFFLDVRAGLLDRSDRAKLIAEWDGHGMIATQSHAFELQGFPAVRFAWPGNLQAITGAAGALVSTLFTSVIVGVVESAIQHAREAMLKRKSLSPYEQIEWVRAENEAWLIGQAFEGMQRAVEANGSAASLEALRGKVTIAELAESVTRRICNAVGGASFNRSSPFGFFFEDVRALGFLRPPWALAFEQLIERHMSALQSQHTTSSR